MNVTNGMMTMRNNARRRAERVTHDVKERAMQMRVDRASAEADTLRTENRLLRDEVESTRSERRRLLDVLEKISKNVEVEVETSSEGEKKRRGGFLWLALLLGGAFVAIRQVADRMNAPSVTYPDDSTGAVRTGSSDAGMAAA